MVQIRNKVDEKYILIDETTGSSGINIGHTLIDVLQNETSSENCHFALKQLRKITFNLTIARFSRKSVIEDLLSPTFFCSCSNQRAFLKVKNWIGLSFKIPKFLARIWHDSIKLPAYDWL